MLLMSSKALCEGHFRLFREGRAQTLLLMSGGGTQEPEKDSFPRAVNQCNSLDFRGMPYICWGSGLCGVRHSMALQIHARETESQELLLGDGMRLRLEMGRDKLGYCRGKHLGCCHPGAVVLYIHLG